MDTFMDSVASHETNTDEIDEINSKTDGEPVLRSTCVSSVVTLPPDDLNVLGLLPPDDTISSYEGEEVCINADDQYKSEDHNESTCTDSDVEGHTSL